MQIDVDKETLCRMVEAYDCPAYGIMNELQDLGYGKYVGGFHDKWTWNIPVLMEQKEEELYQLFLNLRKA